MTPAPAVVPVFGRYAGDKNLVLVEGDHNSPRPRFLFDSAAIFLQNYLQVNSNPCAYGEKQRSLLRVPLGDMPAGDTAPLPTAHTPNSQRRFPEPISPSLSHARASD